MWCTRLEEGSFSDDKVLELCKQFNCVVIDKDVEVDVVEKMDVHSFPCMMILNKEEQKILRWSGYSDTQYFLARLDEALKRYEVYKDGKEWDVFPERTKKLLDEGAVAELPTPLGDELNDVITGVAAGKSGVWIASGGRLLQLDPATGKVAHETSVEGFVQGLCFNGDDLMVYSSVYPPKYELQRYLSADSKFGDAFAFNEVKFCTAFATDGKDYYTIAGMSRKITQLDGETGEITKEVTIQWEGNNIIGAGGLAWDGKHPLTVIQYQKKLEEKKDGALLMDKNRPVEYAVASVEWETGAVLKSVKVNYPLRSISYFDGKVYASEQPEWDYDKNHKRFRVNPKEIVVYSFDWKNE